MSILKLTKTLVNGTFNFQMQCVQLLFSFLAEKKDTPHIYCSKNMSTLDFICTISLNEFLPNGFVKPLMLELINPRKQLS